MDILFEDKDIIAAVKPVGISSQADSSGKDSMITLLSSHTGGTVYPLHRLDRDVGGVTVYAKTKSAAASLSRDIAEHRFNKHYIAMLHGAPEKEEAVLEDLLFHDRNKNKSYTVKRKRNGVKDAKLAYKILKSAVVDGNMYSAVSVQLFTGRTHQIRVQFASRGMPLAGDKKYGAKDSFNSIGLWSEKIGFTHPKTDEKMLFTAPCEIYIKDYFNI